MTTKLTLSIDKQIIEQAKKYAKTKNKSISGMVEDYLEVISSEEDLLKISKFSPGELTDSITGLFAQDYHGEDYKTLLEESLNEKNL